MRTFKTLLLREWLQYWRGWVLVCVGPALLTLTLVYFADIQFSSEETPEGAMVFLRSIIVMLPGAAWAIAFAAVCLQAAGLARRDQQDRSIEFWLSLPTSQWQTVGAVLCMHFLLVPLAASLVGLLAAWPTVWLFMTKSMGAAVFQDLALNEWGPEILLITVRMVTTNLAAVLWASPFIVGVMAASAWLKRWGLPVVALIAWPLPKLLAAYYGWPHLQEAIGAIGRHALAAPLFATGRTRFLIVDPPGVSIGSTEYNTHAIQYVLKDLASPLFLAVMLTSLFFAWLLVLHRERGS